MPTKKKLLVVILGLAVALVGWKVWGAKEEKLPQYQTARVERGTIISAVSASGQVLSSGRLPIQSQASGIVAEVFVKNGDRVAAGQRILRITLDPTASVKNASAWSSYLAAKAALYSTQSTMFSKWKTYIDLATNSTYQNTDGAPNETNRSAAVFHVAKDDWLKAEADYKNQQAVVAAAWQNYQQTAPELAAPVAGQISDLTYVPGMLVSSQVSSGLAQSQTIATIVSDSQPLVTVNLSETGVNKAREGAKTTLAFDALPDKTFTGKIMGINKSGVVTSGVTNYPVTIQLDTNSTEVLPNMSASANILVASKQDVLFAPSAAVQKKGETAVVRRRQKIKGRETEEVVTVEVGLSSDSQTEIISGLAEGDEVITGTTTTSRAAGATSPFNTFRVGGGLGGRTR